MSGPAAGLVVASVKLGVAPHCVTLQIETKTAGALLPVALTPGQADALGRQLQLFARGGEALLDAEQPEADGEGIGVAHGGTVSPAEPSFTGKGEGRIP